VSSFLFIDSGVQYPDALLAHLGRDSAAVQLHPEIDGPSQTNDAFMNVKE